MRQMHAGKVELHTRHEMLELVVVDGRARGIVVRDMVTGKIETHMGWRRRRSRQRRATATSSTCRRTPRAPTSTAIWRAHKKRRRYFANPCYTQIHPTCIPVKGDYQSKLTLMSESLRNDGRVWVPKKQGRQAAVRETFQRTSATTTSSASTRALEISRRATSPRARPRRSATRGAVSARPVSASTSTSRDAIQRLGKDAVAAKLRQPLRHVREHHRREPVSGADAHLPGDPLHDGRAVGRLQPDEHDPRAARHRRGELLRSRCEPPRGVGAHAGARRRLLRHPVHDRRLLGAQRPSSRSTTRTRPCRRRCRTSSSASTNCSPSKAREPWTRSTASSASSCGTSAAWRATSRVSKEALQRIPELREQYWSDVKVLGGNEEFNQSLEKAGPSRRLSRAGRTHVPGRARAPRVVWRPLPGGVPDAGRRGDAQRRRVRTRQPPGSTRARAPLPSVTSSRSSSRTSPYKYGATSKWISSYTSGARRTVRTRAASSATTPRTSVSICLS